MGKKIKNKKIKKIPFHLVALRYSWVMMMIITDKRGIVYRKVAGQDQDRALSCTYFM